MELPLHRTWYSLPSHIISQKLQVVHFPMKRKRLILQQPNLAQIGTNDLLIGDSTSCQIVPFKHLQPYAGQCRPTSGCRQTLKDACILKIVENSHLLNTRLLYDNRDLEKLWLEIWKLILANSKDSFHLFNIFANVFGASPLFQAHSKPNGNNPRIDTLAKDLAPSFTKHRIDQLFSLVDITSLCRDITKFSNIVVLDLTNCGQVSKNDLFSLSNLASLHSLDLSMVSSLDDSILKSWSMVIKMGLKLQNLNVFSINHCPNVTHLGMKNLMSCGGSLFYIEATIGVDHLHWSRWDRNHKLIKLTSGLKWWITSGKLCRDDTVKNELRRKIRDGSVLHEIRVSDSVEFSSDFLSTQMEKLWSRRKIRYHLAGVKSYYRKSQPTSEIQPAKVKRKAGTLKVVKRSSNFLQNKSS